MRVGALRSTETGSARWFLFPTNTWEPPLLTWVVQVSARTVEPCASIGVRMENVQLSWSSFLQLFHGRHMKNNLVCSGLNEPSNPGTWCQISTFPRCGWEKRHTNFISARKDVVWHAFFDRTREIRPNCGCTEIVSLDAASWHWVVLALVDEILCESCLCVMPHIRLMPHNRLIPHIRLMPCHQKSCQNRRSPKCSVPHRSVHLTICSLEFHCPYSHRRTLSSHLNVTVHRTSAPPPKTKRFPTHLLKIHPFHKRAPSFSKQWQFVFEKMNLCVYAISLKRRTNPHTKCSHIARPFLEQSQMHSPSPNQPLIAQRCQIDKNPLCDNTKLFHGSTRKFKKNLDRMARGTTRPNVLACLQSIHHLTRGLNSWLILAMVWSLRISCCGVSGPWNLVTYLSPTCKNFSENFRSRNPQSSSRMFPSV